MKEQWRRISFRDVRNAVFGAIVVFGGLGLAFVTLWAQQIGNPRLAGAAAIASLVFVVMILLLVVPPLARGASREVSSFDLPLEITSGGLIFLGIVAIVGFAAWNTGNNLLFLVLSFLLATLAVSFFVNGANLNKLKAKVRFPDAIFAGEPTIFTVSLENNKWLFPVFSITVSLRGALNDDPFGGRKFQLVRPPESLAKFFRLPFVKRIIGYFLHVPRRGEVEQQTEQIFTTRGQFIIKDFELSTRFPFGFWHRRRRLTVAETAIFIFPQLIDVRREFAAFSPNIGQFVSNKRGAGQDLLGLREYQPSDDVRRVDWKATARTGQITVRQFAAEDERRATVILNTNVQAENETERAAKFERGVQIAASLVGHFTASNNQARLVIDKTEGNFGADKKHLHESLRRLAIVELPETKSPSAEEFKIPESEGELQILVTPEAGSEETFSGQNIYVLPY